MAEPFELPGMRPYYERYPRLRRALSAFILVGGLASVPVCGYYAEKEINERYGSEPSAIEAPADDRTLVIERVLESKHNNDGRKVPVFDEAIAVKAARDGDLGKSIHNPVLIQLDENDRSSIYIVGNRPIQPDEVRNKDNNYLEIWQYTEDIKFCAPEGKTPVIKLTKLGSNNLTYGFEDDSIGDFRNFIPQECQVTVELPPLP
jgi:hypothetical protein